MAKKNKGAVEGAESGGIPFVRGNTVNYLETALEARLAREKADREEAAAEAEAAAKAQAAKPPVAQDHVSPKMTGAILMETFPRDMEMARQRRLQILARKHPEVAAMLKQ